MLGECKQFVPGLMRVWDSRGLPQDASSHRCPARFACASGLELPMDLEGRRCVVQGGMALDWLTEEWLQRVHTGIRGPQEEAQ